MRVVHNNQKCVCGIFYEMMKAIKSHFTIAQVSVRSANFPRVFREIHGNVEYISSILENTLKFFPGSNNSSIKLIKCSVYET